MAKEEAAAKVDTGAAAAKDDKTPPAAAAAKDDKTPPANAGKKDDAEAAKKDEQPPAAKDAKDTKKDGDEAASKDGKEKPASKDGDSKETPKAPEKYSLTVPKDGKALVNAEDLKTLESFAKSKEMTNEQAQQLLDDHVERITAQSVNFRTVTEADATYGGDNLEQTEKFSKLALDKLRPAGTPRGDGLRSILSRTGYGNNLEIVSLLADIGRQMAEDTPGASATSEQRLASAADKLYDKTKT